MPRPLMSTRTRRRSSIRIPIFPDQSRRGASRVAGPYQAPRSNAHGAGQVELVIPMRSPPLLPTSEAGAEADLLDPAGVGVLDGGCDEDRSGTGRAVRVTAAYVIEETVSGADPHIDGNRGVLGVVQGVEEDLVRSGSGNRRA